ncbi:hypothetical protein [Komagataeibacter kakiaceti]
MDTGKEVVGEAFFKKLQEDVAFLKKGDTQKLLLFLINELLLYRFSGADTYAHIKAKFGGLSFPDQGRGQARLPQ